MNSLYVFLSISYRVIESCFIFYVCKCILKKMEGISRRARPIRSRILEETGNEIVADWYLDVVMYFLEHLSDYDTDEIGTVENMLRGFDEAFDNLTEHGGGEVLTPNIDQAYHIFLTAFIRMPCFSHMPRGLLAISLARFFLEKFFYIPPPPEIELSPSSDTSSDVESISSWEDLSASFSATSSDSGYDAQNE